MKLSIHSLKNTLFDGSAEKLIVHTPLGEITVLDHHLPMVTVLSGPAAEVVGTSGEKTVVPITSGFLEVRPESEVVILAQ